MGSRESPARQENLYISERKSFEIRGGKKLTAQALSYPRELVNWDEA